MRELMREHPVIVTVVAVSTLVGGVAGYLYLGPEWSAARRIAAGAVGGAGAAIIVTATRLIG